VCKVGHSDVKRKRFLSDQAQKTCHKTSLWSSG